MSPEPAITVGQVLIGPLFNEPMEVVTVQSSGVDSVVAGLVGEKTARYRQVSLTAADIAALTVSGHNPLLRRRRRTPATWAPGVRSRYCS